MNKYKPPASLLSYFPSFFECHSNYCCSSLLMMNQMLVDLFFLPLTLQKVIVKKVTMNKAKGNTLVFCVLCFVFCVLYLCFVFCVLCFVFCILCFVFCVVCCVLCHVSCVLCHVLCIVCCVLCVVMLFKCTENVYSNI
jgi:hypothetical protein